MNLYEKIYLELKQRIKNGEFAGGVLLPTEKELQEKYNVSRITVKQAYRLLENEGAVERIPGRGTLLKKHISQPKKPMLGVILCNYDVSFGENLLKSIEDAASDRGYRILTARSFDNHTNESRIIEDFINLDVSGIIIQNCHGAFTKSLVKLFIQEFPVVSVDRYSESLLIPSVSSDNFGGSYEAAKYLLSKGHKDILFVTSNPDRTSTMTDRLSGFEKALIDNGISISPRHFLTNLESPVERTQKNISFDIEKIIHAMHSGKCTAVLACDHFILELCDKAKKQIYGTEAAYPELVCFDLPNLMQVRQQFTHVYQDEEALGRIAVEKLCAIIKNEQIELRTVVPAFLVKH